MKRFIWLILIGLLLFWLYTQEHKINRLEDRIEDLAGTMQGMERELN